VEEDVADSLAETRLGTGQAELAQENTIDIALQVNGEV
jgi:hypothetical protein